MLDIKDQFPILSQKVWGHPLVYLDNAATTQKPITVINTITDYYKMYNSNVHRGVHYLSQVATDKVEEARDKIKSFIQAEHVEEIIFTKGTTDSINLIADSYGYAHLKEGDEILLSMMEHHSNIVPWFKLAERLKLNIKFIPFTSENKLDIENIDNYITEKTKLISITWVSNTLGTINDVKTIINKAHTKNIVVVIDAAQAVQHLPINVKELDIDFLVASGHKMYGPTGIGFLYGKISLLESMSAYQGGGSMIKSVTTTGYTQHDIPFRFEAGTPHVEGIIGLGSAVDFITDLGIDTIYNHENDIMSYAKALISETSGISIVGENSHQSGALSLIFDHCHPSDVGELIDKKGVAVRVGQHCCQPIMDHFDIKGTLRISFAAYTTKNDIDMAVLAIKKAINILS